MRTAKLFVALALALLVTPALGSGLRPSSADDETVGAYLTTQIRDNRIPGVALAIVRRGEVVFARGYGEATPGRAMTAQTPMLIGLVSKSFTAVAVMQLVEQGKVSLDAPVQGYLPFFNLRDPAQAARITVRHLLNQTSGLTPASLPNDALPDDATLRDAVDRLASATLTTEPGTTFAYANHNYTLLGLLIETVSGESYGEYVKKHILDPLGMRQTYVDPMEAARAGLAQGYNHVLGFPVARAQPQPRWVLPAGGIVSTAEDLGEYLAFHLHGAGGAVLSDESRAVLHALPQGVESPYAMGWFKAQRAGVTVLEHPGGVETFHADVVLLPEQNLAVVLLYNFNGVLQTLAFYNPVLEGVIALLTQQPPGGGGLLGVVYLAVALIVVLDVVRKVVALLRIPAWGRQALRGRLPSAARSAVLEMLGGMVLLVGLPLLVFTQAGLTALRVVALWYHADIAAFILLTSLLSLALGAGRLIWLRANART